MHCFIRGFKPPKNLLTLPTDLICEIMLFLSPRDMLPVFRVNNYFSRWNKDRRYWNACLYRDTYDINHKRVYSLYEYESASHHYGLTIHPQSYTLHPSQEILLVYNSRIDTPREYIIYKRLIMNLIEKTYLSDSSRQQALEIAKERHDFRFLKKLQQVKPIETKCVIL